MISIRLLNKEAIKIIGLMSGTSHDGVDGALVEIAPSSEGSKGWSEGIDVKLIDHVHVPYPEPLTRDIRKAFRGDTELICRLNFRLGEIFSKVVLSLLERINLTPKDIDAVASHGQTIYHIPPSKGSIKKTDISFRNLNIKHHMKSNIISSGSTLQIGEGAVIAERTGILTISDFRTADMAAGGNGAPLVPLADYLLFKKPGMTRIILNMGGIANITVVKGRKEDTIAYDIGPGNALMDEAMRYISGGEKHYDKDGAFAQSGKVIDPLLKELMGHPYLRKRPPKSTGREMFGADMVEDIFKKYSSSPSQDILATLTLFTAKIIHKEVTKHKPHELILSGGGVFNKYLVELIRELFSPAGIRITTIDQYDIHPQAKEALSFAILGYRTLNRLPGNIPAVTGARREVILGKISLPVNIKEDVVPKMYTDY